MNTIGTGLPNLVNQLPLESPTRPTSPTAAEPGGDEATFSDTLHGALHQLNDLQEQAQQQVGSLLNGQSQDLHGAMIAVEKADLSFQLMLQVRNKIVAAYQEVSRMQI
jgi:flagellar hook-basal body complex protein FliE